MVIDHSKIVPSPIMDAPKIKLFQFVQKRFIALGFDTPPQPEQRCELNHRNLFYFFELFGQCIPITLYVFLRANTAYEYSNGAYATFTELSVGIQMVAFLYRKGLFINLIENYQKFIEKRKRFLIDEAIQNLNSNFLTLKISLVIQTKNRH